MSFYKSLKNLLVSILTCRIASCRTYSKPKVVIVIFPGLGLHPRDYEDILPKNEHRIYLNIWTDDELQRILDNFAPPGTEKYDNWFKSLVEKTKKKMMDSLKDDYLGYDHIKEDNTKIVFFSHSMGSQVAKALYLGIADMIMTYGGVLEIDDVLTNNLLGTEDKIASKYFKDWPKMAKPVDGANHFSCVSEKAALRSLKWRDKLGIPKISEVCANDDHQWKIKRDLTNYVNAIKD